MTSSSSPAGPGDDPIFREHYRTHRPMVERTIAWLVAPAAAVRYRGVDRNQQWLAHPPPPSTSDGSSTSASRHDGTWTLT